MSENSPRPVIATTDGSPHSFRVLPHAARFAAARDASLVMLRVLQPEDIVKEPDETDADAVERMRASALEAMQAELARQGLEADAQVEVTVGGERVNEALLRRSGDADLLAMDSQGRGALARLLYGSVARDLLGKSQTPVMLSGPALLAPPAEGHYYRVVVTTDLSEASQEVLRGLAPLMVPGRFQVTLLHVHERLPSGQDDEAQLRQAQSRLGRLRELLPPALDVNVVVTEVPRMAGIDTAIMEEANEAGAHAIAMATHGHSAQRQLLMGSVAMSILRRSVIPLILTSKPAEGQQS